MKLRRTNFLDHPVGQYDLKTDGLSNKGELEFNYHLLKPLISVTVTEEFVVRPPPPHN